MHYESMPRSFFIHAGGTPALPVTPSHRLLNPALLVAPLTPGYWLSRLRRWNGFNRNSKIRNPQSEIRNPKSDLYNPAHVVQAADDGRMHPFARHQILQ